MEKKPPKKKAPAKAPKKKPVKAPAAKAGAKKSAKPKGKAEPEVRKTEAETRSVQEEGSIAPPSRNLVSAFALFKSKKRPIAAAPLVTRLAPGMSFPKAPAALPPAAEAPAHPPTPAPSVKPAAAPAAPAAKSPAPVAAAPAAAPAAKPAAPAAPAPLPKPPAAPSQFPSRPAAPQRPGGPNYGQQRPGQFRPGSHPGQRQPARPHAPRPVAKPAPEAPKSSLKKIKVSPLSTVRELAERMEIKPNDLIKKLISLGVFATINQRLETESATIIAAEFGFELEMVEMFAEEAIAEKAVASEKPESLKPRSPVVTIMGHVDHGKTSLLDAIRSSRVAEGESGGITQHIGAYKVRTSKGEIVFLDTPGHEAFTAMRARGAKVTDIVVLVVSATDGVMPQTLEAIDHAKAAEVPIVVAVNKIDLPGANPQKIRQELANHGLMSEEWGGKNIFVDVSAKKRINLDGLLENIALQAEILELRANPERPGYGVVLEARLDPRKGNLATVLVQAGTVKVGDAFVAGLAHGKIKALIDDTGRRVMSAGPSTPVEMLGIMGEAQAGDVFSVVSDERQARELAQKRALIYREQTLAHQRHMTLVSLKSQLTTAGGVAAVRDLNIVLKADVQGSLQALRDSLEKLSNAECRVRIIHSGVGNASESDILLASASDAVTLVFHTEIEQRASELAAREGVEVRKYEIIYDLIADVSAALEGLLAPEIVDVVVGKGEVREIFNVKGGKIAGCFIRDGKVVRGGLVRVVRGGASVWEGKISGLKRFKDDVKEVENNLECGMSFEGFTSFQKGDQLECIVKESRTRRLSESKQS
jgi:translation initiation factor IF-2